MTLITSTITSTITSITSMGSPLFDTHRNYLKVRFSDVHPINKTFVKSIEFFLTSLETNGKMPTFDDLKCAVLLMCILTLLPLYRVDYYEDYDEIIPSTWYNTCMDAMYTMITDIKMPHFIYIESLKHSLGLSFNTSINSPELMFYEYIVKNMINRGKTCDNLLSVILSPGLVMYQSAKFVI